MLRHEAISLPQMLLKEKINKFTEEREKYLGAITTIYIWYLYRNRFPEFYVKSNTKQ